MKPENWPWRLLALGLAVAPWVAIVALIVAIR